MYTIIDMGQTIKKKRSLLGFTQSDVAELTGISLRTIRSMEKGTGQASLLNWYKILDVLGLELTIQTKQVTNA